MNGICIRCGKQMRWAGHLWLCCEHCGQLQLWPIASEREGTIGAFHVLQAVDCAMAAWHAMMIHIMACRMMKKNRNMRRNT